MNYQTIRELMYAEHKELEKMISQSVQSDILSDEKCMKHFKLFEKKLNKHMDAEDKVIYEIADRIQDSIQELSRHIFSDHNSMRAQIKNIETALTNKAKVELTTILEALKNHHRLEDKEFYPKLDQLLNKKEAEEFFGFMSKNL